MDDMRKTASPAGKPARGEVMSYVAGSERACACGTPSRLEDASDWRFGRNEGKRTNPSRSENRAALIPATRLRKIRNERVMIRAVPTVTVSNDRGNLLIPMMSLNE